MLKKYYLSKKEVETIQISLGELVISEKKKSKENRELIEFCKNLIEKLETSGDYETNKKKDKK